MRRVLSLGLALIVGATLAACSSGSSRSAAHQSPAAGPARELWPAPADPLGLTRKAGLAPETHETLVFHVHAHLDVYVDGQPVQVPAGIGINISDPAVHTDGQGASRTYGGISPACKQVCISPLHTHDTSGILHTESASATPNTLGQFFTEWGVALSSRCVADRCGQVAFYVDGNRIDRDPTSVQLLDHEEIAVVVGRPPATIPSTADFSQA